MEIKEYWDQRASSEPSSATTDDIYLRVLEREVLGDQLRQLGCGTESQVLDLGCGDGQTVGYLSDEFGCQVVGVDYSPAMIELCRQRSSGVPAKTGTEFLLGDVREAAELLASRQFDFVITDRCLINLKNTEEQFKAMRGIAELVKTGGSYLAIENFEDGQDQLNRLRELFELPPIQVRWHNRYFNEDEFRREAARHFKEIRKVSFSSAYYLATRVIYSKLCQAEGVTPDYLHPIHQFSVRLPHLGDFSPIKLFVMTK